MHSSTTFKDTFETIFGVERSILSCYVTRWNSTLRQVRSIISLPAQGLMDLCHATGHAELILSGKEWQMLNELYNLLAPFEEATNLVQAAVTPTLGYVVPAVLALSKHLENDCKTMKYLEQMGKALKTSLWKRFGIFQNALMTDEADSDAPATTFGNSEAFGDPVSSRVPWTQDLV